MFLVRCILSTLSLILATTLTAQGGQELGQDFPPVVGGYEDVSPAATMEKPMKKLLKKSYVAQEKAKMKELKRKQANAIKKLNGSRSAGK